MNYLIENCNKDSTPPLLYLIDKMVLLEGFEEDQLSSGEAHSGNQWNENHLANATYCIFNKYVMHLNVMEL